MRQFAARDDVVIHFGDDLFDDVYIGGQSRAECARHKEDKPAIHIFHILPLPHMEAASGMWAKAAQAVAAAAQGWRGDQYRIPLLRYWLDEALAAGTMIDF